LDAVDFAIHNGHVNKERIYIVGESGGGHIALLMAGRFPYLWTAVSAWAPIVDLKTWYDQSRERGSKCAQQISACCGGLPDSSEGVNIQYRNRSPLTFLRNAGGLPVDINAGIHDGHTGSVPISHSLLAFNALAETNGFPSKIIPPKLIESIVQNKAVPGILKEEKVADKTYHSEILFRRAAEPVRVTVFEGGHEIDYDAAFAWLEKQKKQREL